jgi:hypothetical protein
MDTDVKVSTVAYDDYLEAVIINQVKYMNWRLGQTAFNTLADMRPDLAEHIRGSDSDPFYADHLPAGYLKVANFLAHVREEW